MTDLSRRQSPLDPTVDTRHRAWTHRMQYVAARGLVGATVLATVLLRPAMTSAEERNRCGCYQDSAGSCLCEKKATCGCPGECEPRGCEERRERDLQKEIQAETKKAEESDRKKSAPQSEDSEDQEAPAKEAATPPRRRFAPAQAKQFGKLLDLYLSTHPGAGAKSLEEVRQELASPAR
jgi:flagellar motility protein MotE (MotC chaperone)